YSLVKLQHLKFFCDAVTYTSVSEAAKMNYVTQSAISQAIGKLEKLFNASLVYHNRQKLYITLEGEIVYENAKAIFKSIQKTFDSVHETKEEISGTLRFVTTKSLGMSFIAPMYKRIKEELPSVELKFMMGGKNLIRTKLKRGEVEFAIVVYDDNFSEFKKLPITTGRFSLYQAKNSPQNLIHQGIFVYNLGGPYVKELQKYFDDLDGELIQVKGETEGWELAARFVELGIGVGFIPDYLVKNNRYSNIEIHSQQIPEYEYEICAIQNHTTVLSKAAKAFIDKFTMD
nr:HTH-type transcriptional regulator CynR [Chlamydiota bacterium]